MRTPLIAGNWKMHGSLSQVNTLIAGIKEGVDSSNHVDVLVCPTFVHLHEVKALLAKSSIQLGAQNLYLGVQGAFTGEVSGSMLKDIGCQFVLVGHSERRTIFKEDVKLIAAKFKAAQEANLYPILCIGETQKEREEGKTEVILREQLESVINEVGIAQFQNALIAYEPVWAIGTGLTATPELADDAHAFIRDLIAQNNVDLAKTIRILYGGSMKADNARALLAKPNIDGGLIGGASLEAKSFVEICSVAEQLTMDKAV